MVRPALVAVLVGVSLFVTVFFLVSPSAFSEKMSNGPAPFMSVPKTTAATASSSTAVGSAPSANMAKRAERYDFRLGESDTFSHVMAVLDVPGAEVEDIVRKTKPVYDLRQLKKDTVLHVYASNGVVQSIEYKFNEFSILHVDRSADGKITATKTELPHEVKTALVSGVIESSLYEDGVKAGADPQAIMALSDIFAWDVDFTTEIKKGDEFKILYEVTFVEGRPIRSGRVLAASMVNNGKKYDAVYFQGVEGGGYYDSTGKSLSRTLLKSPLRYRRVTSYFTNRRFHPILNVYRPHHGIDYAAPSGTPVEAAGGGHVAFSGWKNGYGNFIEIKHSNGYVTGYGHLSRILPGARAGAKITQGQVIGLVGSTGISTGPHLHYEIRAGGKLINPLGIKSEPNHSITKKESDKFASVRDDAARRLAGPSTVALLTNAEREPHPLNLFMRGY